MGNKTVVRDEIGKIDMLLDLAKDALRDLDKMLQDPECMDRMMTDKERMLERKMDEVLKGYLNLKKIRGD